MVNHSLLLNRLKYRFWVDGTMLNWLHNYLTDRSQKGVIDADQGHAELDPITLSGGVPQGSVLGPILFTLYISSLRNICWKQNVEYHEYADDQQGYLTFTPTETSKKEQCIENLKKYWWHPDMDEDGPVEVEWQQDKVHDAGHKEKSEQGRCMHHLHKGWRWWDKQCHVSQRSGVPSGLCIETRHACKQVDQCSVYYTQKDSKHSIPITWQNNKNYDASLGTQQAGLLQQFVHWNNEL